MHAAYVGTMLISYVLEALPQSAQIVKPAMLEYLVFHLLMVKDLRYQGNVEIVDPNA
jgi:hypothetical protein